MTTVVLQLRDEDLGAGRVVGRVELIRAGGTIGEAGTIRDLADLVALLFGLAPTPEVSDRSQPVEEAAMLGRGLDSELGERDARLPEDA